MRLVAHAAIEGNYRAVPACAHVTHERLGIDRVANEDEQVGSKLGFSGHARSSATADRRKKGDFVAGVERSTPGSKFLIAGGHQRTAIADKLRMALGAAGEQFLDGSAFGDVEVVLSSAHNFPEAAEKEHLDANGWRSLFHLEIVTCGAADDQWQGATPTTPNCDAPARSREAEASRYKRSA